MQFFESTSIETLILQLLVRVGNFIGMMTPAVLSSMISSHMMIKFEPYAYPPGCKALYRVHLRTDAFHAVRCTTSQGYFVLIDVGLIQVVKSYNVRVWRLNSEFWNWEKTWEINIACVALGPNCVPMAINYFDIDIIYLWDLDGKCFLACNLRTRTKYYEARKDASCALRRSCGFKAQKDVVVYKEDTFCFAPCSCLSQFVPSFQIVPT